MNKKFLGLALTATVVGGYVYYRHNKLKVDRTIQDLEGRIKDTLMGALAPGLYPEAGPEEGEVHG